MTTVDIPERPEVRWFTAEQTVSCALLEQAEATQILRMVRADQETILARDMAKQGFTKVYAYYRQWPEADLPVRNFVLDVLGVKEAPGG